MHSLSNNTHSANAVLRLSIFSLSKFVVGSSRASIPQFELKVSARAIRIIRDARTYETTNTQIEVEKYYHPKVNFLQHIIKSFCSTIQKSSQILNITISINNILFNPFQFYSRSESTFSFEPAPQCNSKL
jgi:hypothetical protein